MDISINVPARANKQQQLLNLIPAELCSIVDNTATISGVYTEENRVPDAYRYIVRVENKTVRICQFEKGKGIFQDQKTNKSKCKSIVVVIESPHVDEYSDSKPISPAQGATGKRIEKHLLGLLNSQIQLLGENMDYDLIISNPVQFQASLNDLHKQPLNSKNSATKAIRDKVWKKIFINEEVAFHERLNSYEPKIVINACTAKLKPIVTNSLLNWKKKGVDIYISNTHPCMWSSKTKLTRHLNGTKTVG